MTMVQMNVRIDAKLKNEVEEVLKGKGVSVSDVIRSLWLYIAARKCRHWKRPPKSKPARRKSSAS